MKEILEAALAAVEAGQRVALSTIVSTRGSLPMSRRSKMLVLEGGTFLGTVGGGCLEPEVFSQGRTVLLGDGSSIFHRFTLTGKHAGIRGVRLDRHRGVLTETLS